jgi:hypothetical protein
VCTAWPVDDRAALEFALAFYGAVLGLDGPPEPMHRAMARARLRAAHAPGGAATWGAYQHYGDPGYRFVPPPRPSVPDRPKSRARSRNRRRS